MTLQLTATKRTVKETAALRREGKVPAVVYGPQCPSQPVAFPATAFTRLYKEAGESTLIDFAIEGASPMQVLIEEVQHDPVTGHILHVDLRQVDMLQEIDAEIELAFAGESPVVKSEGGVLVKSLSHIKVRCLPKDLVTSFPVDLSVLKTFGAVVRVSDLPLPSGMKLLCEAKEIVATVVHQKEEKEELVRTVQDVEVVGKEPKAEGEGEEAAAEGKEEKKEEHKKEKKEEK